jgi:hypothetical protein
MGLAMRDNALSMPHMKMRRSLRLLSICTPDACWKLSARDLTSYRAGQGAPAPTSSSESATTVVLRQGTESGHAVSLASIAEHPHKQDSCMCLDHAWKPREEVSVYHIVSVSSACGSEAKILFAQAIFQSFTTVVAPFSSFCCAYVKPGTYLCAWKTHLVQAYFRLYSR